MDSFEINKIVAAILMVALLVIGIGKLSNIILSSCVALTVSPASGAPDNVSICKCSFGFKTGASSYLYPLSNTLVLNARPTVDDVGNKFTLEPELEVTLTVGNDR